jgi:hypothetical protein
MNDAFRDVKGRLRSLEEILWQQGGRQHLEFAQALSRVRRLVRRGDRSREPTAEIRVLLERAESLGRSLRPA